MARRTESPLSDASRSSTTHPIRIVLAKIGLDGHDRGIKVVARGLRDAGFHVIYGGIWQSPTAVAQAVLDEDAAWLGISLLNGAHLPLMRRVVDELRSRGMDDIGIVLGGIVPPQDLPPLREIGISGVFGPGTAMAEIAEFLASAPRSRFNAADLVHGCRHGDRRAMSRLLSQISENDQPDLIFELLNGPDQPAEQPQFRKIAFTGNAGVGKSSLIARVVGELRSHGQRVAVLSCDPQSPITGGALLGDRIRLAGCLPDDGVFVRSLPVLSGAQGIASHMNLMARALELFGFDLVLIETAGTGQGDVAVQSVADSIVLVLQPESGDSVQWEKAGQLEIADVVVIHKSDLPGADRLEAELREYLLLSGDHSPELVRVSAATNDGVPELCETILNLPGPA